MLITLNAPLLMANVTYDNSRQFHGRLISIVIQQGVAITGRNRTGPPCSVGRPIPTRPTASRPAGSVTDDDRRKPAKQYWPIRCASNKQACRSSLSDRNVCWPRRMLPPGESWWVCRRDRRTDTRPLHYAFRYRCDQRNI